MNADVSPFACPFCGSAARIANYRPTQSYVVVCTNDPLHNDKGPWCDIRGPLRQTKIEAIAAWNHRVPVPATEITTTRQQAEIGRANLIDAWNAMRLIRETIETLGPVGALRAGDHIGCHDAPTFHAEAIELCRGIQAIWAAAN